MQTNKNYFECRRILGSIIKNTTRIVKKIVLTEKTIKFIGRISTMGKRKVAIYVPQEYHEEILKRFKGKTLKITLEEIAL